MGQTCRVCGVHIASGFTFCDTCYYKTNKAKADELKVLKRIPKLETLEADHESSAFSSNSKKRQHPMTARLNTLAILTGLLIASAAKIYPIYNSQFLLKEINSILIFF